MSYDHLWENRWGVWQRFKWSEDYKGEPNADGTRTWATKDAHLDGWVVCAQSGPDEPCEPYEVEFGPDEREAAEALAAEFNRYERQGPLNPFFDGRRAVLSKLPDSFWQKYGEGPGHTDLPTEPERYAVVSWSERYGEPFTDLLTDDLDKAVAAMTDDGQALWDLDLGVEIPVEVTARIAAEEER